MKKLFSIVLMAALLVTCISPALYSSAADLPSFVIETNAEYEETTNSVDVSIGIADNPGISEMSVLVYYLDSEMSIAKSEYGTVLNSSFNSVAAVRPSNHPQLRSYFPADEFGDTIYQVSEVLLYSEDGDETANGTFLNLTFDLKGDHSAGNTFTYGVKIKSAKNAAGEEIAFAGKQEGTLTFTPDPYKEIYKDFTVFATDAEVDLNAREATVDVRMVHNPGVYVIRIFVAYDDALTLKSFTPVNGIFTNEGANDEMTVSSDIAIVPPAEHGPDGILRALESKNISREGRLVGYILCVPSVEENRNNDGVVARLTFELPENMQQGDSYSVDVCWGDTDFTAIDMNTVGDNGLHPIVPVGDKTANGTGHIATAICEHANVVLETVKEATCSETGLRSGVCPDCGQTVEEVIPMIDHTPAEAETVAPTCTEAGKIVTKCSVCGEVISTVDDAEHPALGHQEGAPVVTKQATCTEKGSQDISCERCDEKLRTEEIAMIPHTETTETVAPTCTEAGKIVTKCSVCQTVISTVDDAERPALGHQEGAPVVTKAATCTEKGSQDIFCERCDEKLRTEEIDMIPHTEKVDVIAPTCVDAGRIITTCTVCGTEISNVEDTEHPATGIHTPGEPEIVEPTETENGSKTIKCTVCGEIISEERIPATGNMNVSEVLYKDEDGFFRLPIYVTDNYKQAISLSFEIGMDSVAGTLDSVLGLNDGTYTVEDLDNGKYIITITDFTQVKAMNAGDVFFEIVIKPASDTIAAEDLMLFAKDSYKYIVPVPGDTTEAPADTTEAPADTTKTPADSTTTASSNNGVKNPPKTGDNMVYVVIVAAIALVGCAAVVIIRKRKVSDK